MSPDSLPFQLVQTELRSKLPFFAIASIVLAAAIASLLLAALRSRERLLFWLGIFSVLYAGRLFIDNGLVQAAMGLDERHVLPWILCLTYVIPIPYALFARELLGSGWKGSISIWFWVQIAFALSAIPIALFSHQSHWTELANGILVVGGTLVILFHIILRREGSAPSVMGLAWPLIVFGVFVVVTNIQAINRKYQAAGINLEPLGFLTLLGGMGFTASRSAIARERKLLEVEQELTTARRIQSSIIPDSSPNLPGLRIATRYQPMTAVAGDFFDFLQTSEDSVTVLVADVSGHGIPAALVASMLKVSFAAQREVAKNPAQVLAGLNAMLRGSLGGQYVTAACAAIDLAAHTITYAGAGHPPSLLLRKNSSVVIELAENGLFIGPFPHATYSNISVPFESGDKLLLYTDGILEATGSDGQEFGQKSVEAARPTREI